MMLWYCEGGIIPAVLAAVVIPVMVTTAIIAIALLNMKAMLFFTVMRVVMHLMTHSGTFAVATVVDSKPLHLIAFLVLKEPSWVSAPFGGSRECRSR